MATLPPREPGLPGPSAGRSQASERLIRALGSRRGQFLLAGLVVLALLALAWHFNVPPRGQTLRAWPDALRGIAASVVLFALGGFGLVRLLLPDRLRRYELLWVLPTGACAVGLAMTVLGFAAVPYPASLALVALAGLAVGAYSVRRRGWPKQNLPQLVWPTFLALAVLAVGLVPMLFKQHYAAPVGTGSDAHMAAGAAQFLKHDYPTSVDVTQPINQMPPSWQSKYPIYYAFAAVSTVSGLATWQVLATLAAVLLALTAIGMFLVAREVFGAPLLVALVAMCFAVLDRESLHVVLTPFLNETWGFFALPFTLVLGWVAVQPGMPRRARLGAIALLAMVALLLVLAYPLEAPIPAIPLIVFAIAHRRHRIAAGERVLRLRDLYRGRRSILWMVPGAVLLAIPVAGALDKGVHAAEALAPGGSLRGWAASTGYGPGFVPWNFFFGLPNSVIGTILLAGVLVLAAWGLARQPPSLAGGLGAVLVLGLLMALYLRQRPYATYFEFKLLAFLGPLVLLLVVLGAARLRWLGAALLVPLSIVVASSAVAEIGFTGYQLDLSTIQLAQWSRALPRDTSIRLDMWPPWQLWTSYFLSSHPLCSQHPLLNGSYPHVAISRKADYIVATLAYGRPADAVGLPLRQNGGYRLYRENPSVPGPDRCSRREF